MWRPPQQESKHFEISGPVWRQPDGKSDSGQGNMGNVRRAVQCSRLQGRRKLLLCFLGSLNTSTLMCCWGSGLIQFTAITCVIMKTEVLNSKIQQPWLVPGDSEVTSKWWLQSTLQREYITGSFLAQEHGGVHVFGGQSRWDRRLHHQAALPTG